MKHQWELDEEALVAKETAYLNDFNWFEKLFDSHIGFISALICSSPLFFMIGVGIGMLIK